MTEIHVEVLKKYNAPVLGLTKEKIAKDLNITVQEVEEIISDLFAQGYLKDKELRSKALGNKSNSIYIIEISIIGKNYLKNL